MEVTELGSEALAEIGLRPVEREEEAHYQEQMAQHHYLGSLLKIAETVWYRWECRGRIYINPLNIGGRQSILPSRPHPHLWVGMPTHRAPFGL